MTRSTLFSYAVVVAVAVTIACAMTERSYLPKDLILGIGFGLFAGFYEWQKAEIRRRIREMDNAIRNHLQVISGFAYIPPKDRKAIIDGQVQGITRQLVSVCRADIPESSGIGHRSAAVASRGLLASLEVPASPKQPSSVVLKAKAQTRGIAS